MAKADCHAGIRRDLHDLLHLREHGAVRIDKADVTLGRVVTVLDAGEPSPAVRLERREPDATEVRILDADAHRFRVDAEVQAEPAVDLDAVLEPTVRHHLVDPLLNEVRLAGGQVPVVLERQRAHPRPGGVDRDLEHVLRPVHEVREGVDVVIDCADEQVVFYPRVDGREGRVVLEHLVEPRPRIELAGAVHGQPTPEVCVPRHSGSSRPDLIAHDRTPPSTGILG